MKNVAREVHGHATPFSELELVGCVEMLTIAPVNESNVPNSVDQQMHGVTAFRYHVVPHRATSAEATRRH